MENNKNNNKYKIISEDLMKNLVDFLDEVQFDAASENDKEAMHKINFCNWAINELLNSYDAYIKDIRDNGKPKKKTRDDYVEETFMDWNLPEMDDDEYEKLVDQFDAFLRGWEKEYLKKHPNRKIKREPREDKFKRPHVNDVAEYMSLDEIKEFLLDDPELTDNERFELYYQEHDRIQREKQRKKEEKGSLSYDEMLKKLKIEPYDPKENKN